VGVRGNRDDEAGFCGGVGQGQIVRRALLLLALVVSTAGIVAAVFGPGFDDGDRLWPTVWLLWGVVGYLILMKRPGNGVGSAALIVGLSWGIGFGLGTLSAAFPGAPAAAWAELINVVLGVIPWLTIVWLLLVFPTGTFVGRWERIVGGMLIVVGSILTVGFAVHPAPMEFSGLPSPLAVAALGDVTRVVTGDDSFMVLVGLVFVTLLLLVLRWRRSEGVERLQYRWLAVGALGFLLSISIGQFAPEDSAGELVWFVGGAAIPLSIGIAILRYRLYEIDRLISRTVSYVVVVGVLAAVFAGIVTMTSSLLQTDSDLAVAVSTLAVAALFNPLRKRVRAVVDHRFNRSRYDAERVMAGFTGSLRDEVDPDQVVDGWVSVVNETMKPATSGVWMRDGA
jgi:hypothetical protein